MINTTAFVCVDVVGFDEGAAAANGTVNAVLGRVFQIFTIPMGFEFIIEKTFDLRKWNDVCGTAFGGHVLWISDRELKNAFQASVAHVVGTRKLDDSRFAYFVKACYAFKPRYANQWLCEKDLNWPYRLSVLDVLPAIGAKNELKIPDERSPPFFALTMDGGRSAWPPTRGDDSWIEVDGLGRRAVVWLRCSVGRLGDRGTGSRSGALLISQRQHTGKKAM